MEHESDDCSNCDWCFWHSNNRIIKGSGGFGSWQSSGDHPNDSNTEDGQNTEKSPGDLRRQHSLLHDNRMQIISIKCEQIKQHWVMKVIHLEWCMKLKFPQTIKWYMHKYDSISKNETQNSIGS